MVVHKVRAKVSRVGPMLTVEDMVSTFAVVPGEPAHEGDKDSAAATLKKHPGKGK